MNYQSKIDFMFKYFYFHLQTLVFVVLKTF